MKKNILLALFMLVGFDSWSQRARDIPGLMVQLSQSKEDTARINLELKLGFYYMFQYRATNHLDSAKFFFDRALQLSIKLHEPDLQYKTMERMAYLSSLKKDAEGSKKLYLEVIAYYHHTGQFAKEARAFVDLAERYHYHDSKYADETIGYYQQARTVYLKNNQPVEAAGVLADIADRHVTFKQFDLAEKELLEALAQYKAVRHKKLKNIYRYLYNLYYETGNYYRALAYCVEAVKSIDVKKQSIDAAAHYQFAAACNSAVKKYDQAVEWIRKAMNVTSRTSTTLEALLAQNLIALNRLEEARVVLDTTSKKQPENIYVDSFNLNLALAQYQDKQGNYGKAVYHYLNAIKEVDSFFDVEQRDKTYYAMCYNGIAGAYLKAKQPAKAAIYLKKNALLFKNSKTSLDPELMADFYDQLYKYALATGNPSAAVKNLELRVALRDSLFTADKDKQLAELNIQYETTQKEQSIKNLQIFGLAQEAKTEKAHLQRNITIVGIVVMMLVSLLFYRNYKQKQAANNTITYKNGLLQHLLSEKEWLLKEVHHRAKNNLHTIIGLLQSQAIYLQDDALRANEISKHRIYAMSLIHQQLYNTDHVKSIDMVVFLPELLDYLGESFGIGKKILFNRSIAQIKLGVSQAIPIALIVNESVTNAIKYAFPAGQPGNIHISMHESAEKINLVIADDGVGIDPGILEKNTNSLGLKLLKGLTVDIDGEIEIVNENGTMIRVSFNRDQFNEFTALSSSN